MGSSEGPVDHERYRSPDVSAPRRDARGRLLPGRPAGLRGVLFVFALNNELVIVRDTGLARLDDGPWPCGDGNLQGNPVVL
jgi:hypothetical protein